MLVLLDYLDYLDDHDYLDYFDYLDYLDYPKTVNHSLTHNLKSRDASASKKI